MAMSSLRRLSEIVLGTDAVQRLRLRQNLLAVGLMGISGAMLHYAIHVGGRPQGLLLWAWTVVALGGMVLIYAAIRSGWSLRLADPSMTQEQIAFAIAAAALAYAQAGALRGACFPALMLILMFGMFQLRTRNAHAMSAYALLVFGLVMGVMAWVEPESYPPALELGHFMMLAFVLPAGAILTTRLGRIRRRASEQREELARALAQLQAIATRDELTGLPNRRQMQALMDQELLRSLRHQHDFCIAIVDLDHFKRVNDEYGHAAGDTVLRAFAQGGQTALRGTDVLARWGGEEFLVLLPETAMPPAVAGMERLRQQTAALRIAIEGGTQVAITVSIGLAGHRRGDTLAQTLERADQLLYKAKAEGRNRTCID
jgi:diguanylate cyclase